MHYDFQKIILPNTAWFNPQTQLQNGSWKLAKIVKITDTDFAV